MKLLVFSDIHGDLKALERIAATEADLYICAGDLSNFARGLDACGEILRPLAGKLLVIPGNHESAADIARFCERFGFEDVHGKQRDLGGWRLACLGYSNPTPFNTPGEYSESELAARLGPFEGLAPLVLVCHCPPRDTPLDQIRPGIHAGSSSVAAFLQRNQPRYFFCGHIHEAAGTISQTGETFAMNVGKRGYLLELKLS